MTGKTHKTQKTYMTYITEYNPMSLLPKQIKLRDNTYDELTAIGHKNDTYDDIVRRLLDTYKKSMKK